MPDFKIIHLSDLHFGTHQPDITSATLEAIKEQKPDLVVVSGDFTQIGSEAEFKQARAFLDSLPAPAFCVPGNHDVPQRNLVQRFFHPYKKYKEFINPDLCPTYESSVIKLAGINSARRALAHWNWANGAISAEQLAGLKPIFSAAPVNPPIPWRICTFHHPVHKVQDMPLDVTVFGGKQTIQTLKDLKIDLVLTGHVHHASITTLGDEKHQCIYLSASTALSHRLRGQENGYNVIRFKDNEMKIDIYARKEGAFTRLQKFRKLRV